MGTTFPRADEEVSVSTFVLGVDSSTQSCKALLVNAETGEVIDSRRASHPDGSEVDPREWARALREATQELLPRADAVSIAAQQHGMVLLDAEGDVVRPALLWNDTRSAEAAERLTQSLGGPAEAARRVGSVPVASYTATKLAWVRENEPENAAKTASVALPHDYLTSVLNDSGQLWTDHGDASGTAYYSPARRSWVPEIAEQALGRPVDLPRLAEPGQAVGKTSGGALIGAGTGDNMGAALGLGLEPGDVAVSMGTSAVAMMISETPTHDASGCVSGFCDATGRYLPLACTLNGAPVIDLGCRLLGVDHEEFSRLALEAEPGSGGAVFLPYLHGERTPNLPNARARFGGLTGDFTRPQMARAMVEGLASSVVEAMGYVTGQVGREPRRVILIGGGAKSEAFRQIFADLVGRPVQVPEAQEFVALGAARQAAWALSGRAEPPTWSVAAAPEVDPQGSPEAYRAYLDFRRETYPDATRDA